MTAPTGFIVFSAEKLLNLDDFIQILRAAALKVEALEMLQNEENYCQILDFNRTREKLSSAYAMSSNLQCILAEIGFVSIKLAVHSLCAHAP